MAGVRFLKMMADSPSIVVIEVPGPLGQAIRFRYDAGTALAAYLVKKEVQGIIGGMVEELAKVMYDQGWKDAKAKKRAKRGWFPSWLQTEK